MSLVSIFKGKGPSGFGYGSTAEDVTEGLDLRGKTILLTGCNSGIGKETLRVLVQRGAHVIAAARTLDKAQAACGGSTSPTAMNPTPARTGVTTSWPRSYGRLLNESSRSYDELASKGLKTCRNRLRN